MEKEEIYKVENYEIFMPLNTNGDAIFNTDKFQIRSWREEDKKIVLLKKLAKNNEQQST